MGRLAEYQHLQERLRILTQNIRLLEMQIANYGLNVPLDKNNEIHFHEQQIEDMEYEKNCLIDEFWFNLERYFDIPFDLSIDFASIYFLDKYNNKHNIESFLDKVGSYKESILIIIDGFKYQKDLCWYIALSMRKSSVNSVPIIFDLTDMDFQLIIVYDFLKRSLVIDGIVDDDDDAEFLIKSGYRKYKNTSGKYEILINSILIFYFVDEMSKDNLEASYLKLVAFIRTYKIPCIVMTGSKSYISPRFTKVFTIIHDEQGAIE